MKLYHGSPKKLNVLKLYKAKGINEFQNKKAVFLTKNFNQAALYALAKSLKSKTQFALPPGRIIIVGKFNLRNKGYVYEMDLPESEVKKGELGNYEFAHEKEIKDFRIHEIELKNYKDQIVYVNSKEEMMEKLR